ncbi:hypothetical protein TIFTF001_051923 [Ficus carica]|uniref:CCHC-type domain-containing protein n=2 Tax=Ficus carica TaxID=3494 RepID=A0AA88EC84_FICCA|nr:hypothetical protein TIFTF001_051923 [Ficus carica]
MGTNACYLCGKEGHFARNCTLNNQNQNPPYPSRNANSQLHAVQARIVNHVSQGITKTGHMRERHLMLLAWMSHPPSLAPWQAKASTPHHLRPATTRKQHTMA